MTALTYFIKGKDFTLGVLIGGLLVVLNLYLMAEIIQGGIKPKKDEARKKSRLFLFVALAFIKTFVLFGGVIIAIYYFNINAVGFLIGVSVLFISLIVEIVLSSKKA